MNSLAVVFLCVAISSASCSAVWGGAATLVGPANLGAALKGPSAQASLIGPDGSAISAGADAGALLAAPKAGGVVTAAVAPGVVAGPGLWGGAPLLPPVAVAPAPLLPPILPPIAPVLPVPAKTGTLIDGPSGTIRTSGSANGLIAAPVGPVVGSVGPLVAPAPAIIAGPAPGIIGPGPLLGPGLLAGKLKAW